MSWEEEGLKQQNKWLEEFEKKTNPTKSEIRLYKDITGEVGDYLEADNGEPPKGAIW